ncbi:MAG TPA: DoxX family membrane protein [Puia sp.]|jgi:putative oxidoreductase|nr:DoxX family membrane protein [Puia sp.]
MNIVYKIKSWGDRHHPKILDIIRMMFGIFLLAKGFYFFNHAAYLRELLIANNAIRESPKIMDMIINYVTYIHIVGGGLIFLGLFTRLGVLLQVPIVVGALRFINILSPYVDNELWLIILVLSLLFLFFIFGSGPLSLDHLFSRMKIENDKTA